MKQRFRNFQRSKLEPIVNPTVVVPVCHAWRSSIFLGAWRIA